MANATGDDTDALIKSNYLQQPSPFSWAQSFAHDQNQGSQLYEHMRNDLLKAQMNKEMQMNMNAQNQGAIKDREVTVEGMRNKAAMERVQAGIDADNEVEPALGDGVSSMATNIYRVMTPSQQRRFEKEYQVLGNNRKGSKMFYRKKGDGAPTGGGARTPGGDADLLPK